MLDLEKIIEPYTYMYTTKCNNYIIETKIERRLETMYYTYAEIKNLAGDSNLVRSFINNNKGKVFIFNTKVLTEDLRTLLYTAVNNVATSGIDVALINAIQIRFGQSIEIPDNCQLVCIDSLFFNSSNYMLEEVRRVLDSALEKNCIIFLYTIADYTEDVLFKNLKMTFNKDKTVIVNFNNFM